MSCSPETLFYLCLGRKCFLSCYTEGLLCWAAAVKCVRKHRMYLFIRLLTHVQPACTCVVPSTPCHLPPSLTPSLCSFPPVLLAVQLGEAGPESKVQVCRLADESQRGSFPPTVCKYVVTLIERSSNSQQLSFLLSCTCVCVCVYVSMATTGAAGHT